MHLAPAQPHDTPSLTRLLSLAFATPPDKVQEWLTNTGLGNFRMYTEDGVQLACCLRVPLGHYFQGSPVKTVGVAGVGVAPEARGRGVASRMMAALLREVYAEGVALSSLYPATLPLYRRAGYEQAGSWFEHRIALREIQLDPTIAKSSTHRVRPFYPSTDLPAIKACYARHAATTGGYLDRGDYIWGRIFHPRAGEANGFIVEHQSSDEGSAAVEGYVFLRQERLPNNRNDVYLTDIVANTPAAAHRIVAFLRDFQSVGQDLVFFGGVSHPLSHILHEQHYRISFKEYWMLRLVNVPLAITSRTYNPHITAEFVMRVSDTALPENTGSWHIKVTNGRATASAVATNDAPSKLPSLTTDVRTLGALYTGFLSPQQLHTLGRLTGDPQALVAAQAVFAGPAPSLPDMF